MLPSRLFRNVGISPGLRSLVTPHASLPSTIAVQLRFYLAVSPRTISSGSTRLPSGTAPFSTSRTRQSDAPFSLPGPAAEGKEETKTTTSQQLPGQIEPRLSITFTCTVPQCGERSTHEFSKKSYTSGIVLVQCPKCKNRHLIADHLGWFEDSTGKGNLRTVEDILAAKGEKIKKGKLNFGGDVEYFE